MEGVSLERAAMRERSTTKTVVVLFITHTLRPQNSIPQMFDGGGDGDATSKRGANTHTLGIFYA